VVEVALELDQKIAALIQLAAGVIVPAG